MGVDTKLYLNTRWGLDDIKTVIERTQDVKVEITSHHKFAPGYFCFNIPSLHRMINVHTYTQTALGTTTLLTMGSNDQSHKILRDIANVFGGLYLENDYDDNYQLIQGETSEEDGIPYFTKYAIIEKGINNHDFKGLIQSTHDWYKNYMHQEVNVIEKTD